MMGHSVGAGAATVVYEVVRHKTEKGVWPLVAHIFGIIEAGTSPDSVGRDIHERSAGLVEAMECGCVVVEETGGRNIMRYYLTVPGRFESRVASTLNASPLLVPAQQVTALIPVINELLNPVPAKAAVSNVVDLKSMSRRKPPAPGGSNGPGDTA